MTLRMGGWLKWQKFYVYLGLECGSAKRWLFLLLSSRLDWIRKMSSLFLVLPCWCQRLWVFSLKLIVKTTVVHLQTTVTAIPSWICQFMLQIRISYLLPLANVSSITSWTVYFAHHVEETVEKLQNFCSTLLQNNSEWYRKEVSMWHVPFLWKFRSLWPQAQKRFNKTLCVPNWVWCRRTEQITGARLSVGCSTKME